VITNHENIFFTVYLHFSITNTFSIKYFWKCVHCGILTPRPKQLNMTSVNIHNFVHQNYSQLIQRLIL